MHNNQTSCSWRTLTTSRSLFIASALTFSGNLSAEVESELDALIISATRMPGLASDSTSAVTILDPEDLESRGIYDLRQALNEVPGVIATSTAGQTGAVGSVFIRGTSTAYSQLVVDGIRLSDSTSQLGNFFGAARIDDIGRIEVLRGPHAAIHGGEAVGGVIWLETARGSGDPTTRLNLEGGSFDSLNGYLSNSGQSGKLSWFAGLGYDGTHNDDIRQDFDQSRGALRLEWAQNENLTLGMTFRAVDSRFEYQNFGTNVDHTDSALATIYANTRIRENWNARFTLGHYRENYDNDTAFGNYGTDLDRTVLSTDHTIVLDPCHSILAGAFFEHNDFSNTIGSDVGQDRFGVHLGWQWTPMESVVTDAVVRWEDYADFDDEITWRVGASWQALEDTRLRAGLGRAFRTPTFLDLYGTAFGAGNPNLKAETSLGWDVGVEQIIAEDHAVSVTWFANSIEDQVRSFPTPPVNISGETPTRGLETALDGSWCDNEWRYRLSWTWLDESLRDMPENTATASLDWRPIDKLLVGVGASYIDERSYGGAPLEDYFLLRIYGSYQVSEHLTLHARVENLTDTDYELSRFGTPIAGPGLGFFTGITAAF
ncbi:TonB-dependent receptor plug domain-containing protein [Haloferula chungangensis]|uniref:TonB-dependent receptor plug domain-containing protein n=1 Tax=Haloferula chungangensis TaxID=1048331 RepID=A0ABW2LD27_9BACT